MTWPADVEPGTEQWQRCRRMFTSDVNAAIDGFSLRAPMRFSSTRLMRRCESSAGELDRRAVAYRAAQGTEHAGGHPGPRSGCVAFIGYHAAAGAEGVLAHAYLANRLSASGSTASSSASAAERVRGSRVRGSGVLVTGDDKARQDAADYAPQA